MLLSSAIIPVLMISLRSHITSIFEITKLELDVTQAEVLVYLPATQAMLKQAASISNHHTASEECGAGRLGDVRFALRKL